MKLYNLYCLALYMLLTIIPATIYAENPVKNLTISGVIKDKANGEILIGATVFVKEMKTGTSSNIYGFYSISMAEGTYHVTYSFMGYESIEKVIKLDANTTVNIELQMKEELLKEVVVVGERKSENVKSNEMGVVKMDIKTIRKIPSLMGEVDIIKAIQLLPGVQTTSEGATGFSVRGGSPDQNLILLDEAVVYNASHLMGFFSVFNNDAIKDVKLYKGDIPPSAGGRLSSLLDVRMKDGNSKKMTGTGGIGTISSRFTLEGPIKKDKISYVLSARRTYADLFLRLSSKEELKDNTLYFYDINGKINFQLDDNNRIFLSAYMGRDVFKNPDFKMSWGNLTTTLRWNHLFNKKLFSNFTIIQSKFDYGLGVPEGQASSFKWIASLNDYSAKADFGFYPNTNNTIKFGIQSTLHHFEPGVAKGTGDESFMSEWKVNHNSSLEHAIYIGNEQQIGANLSLKYGLRYSVFQNIGYGVQYHYNDQYVMVDSTVYKKGEIFNTYSGLEPRLGINYSLTETSSIKANYSRTKQYIHLASNSTSGTPLDIWFSSSPNVKPQVADQFAVGYFRNFKNNSIETSIEAYYKKNYNAIDFKDQAELLLNKYLEGELRFGTAESYGVEFFVKYQKQKFSGWISYTLSKSTRKIETVFDGKAYPSNCDKPHNIAVVANYDLSKRIVLGLNWVFASGAPITFPTGRFVYGNIIGPVYSDRNSYRMPAYHRLDLSLTLKEKEKPGKKWHGEWNLSLYNAYARKNAWVINFVPDNENPNVTYAEMTYLFGIVPSITYNFNF